MFIYCILWCGLIIDEFYFLVVCCGFIDGLNRFELLIKFFKIFIESFFF